jgi:hypothetical protein
MSRPTSDSADEYAVDRYREECHVDDEGYLHTDSASAHPDRIIITYE